MISIIVANTTKKWWKSKQGSIICMPLQFIMGYKTPLASANASFFVQILLMELFNMGLLVVKPPPMHLNGFFTYIKKDFVP
jgi:hypothetical protein